LLCDPIKEAPMRGSKFLLLCVTVLAAGVSGWALERYVFNGSDPLTALRSAVSENTNQEKDNPRILYWVAPMDPSYRRDGPGKSPMGMDLIPVYEGEEPEEPGVVKVSAAAAEAIGVRYATAQRETLTPEIRTFGRVAYDERRTRHIHVRADGWVDRLDVRREGERVQKGDLLFTYFAPDLSIAAMEYRRELQRGDSRGINATRLKLRSLGVSERQIGALRPGSDTVENIEVYAPQDGVIAEIDIAEGMFITPDIPVVSLSDLSRVWVLAEVIERDIPHVRAGMAATIEALSGVPSARSGVIDTVFPTLKEDTRTIELRLVVDNPDGALHPNALVKVALESDPMEHVLTAPASAVIRLGDAARVVQVMGEGRFKPVPVAIGPRVGERIVVEDGLQEGDRIVAAAHFLIDSESSLQDGLDRMAAAHGAHPGMDHQGMDHQETDHQEMDHGQPEPANGDLVWAEGKIVAIEADRRVVTLDHAPVPALGWPGMVMDFRVAADVPLEELGVDDEIAFGFVQTPEGRYEIHEVRDTEHQR
jgi:membrane fusion protein, copper/silver efflux system